MSRLLGPGNEAFSTGSAEPTNGPALPGCFCAPARRPVRKPLRPGQAMAVACLLAACLLAGCGGAMVLAMAAARH